MDEGNITAGIGAFATILALWAKGGIRENLAVAAASERLITYMACTALLLASVGMIGDLLRQIMEWPSEPATETLCGLALLLAGGIAAVVWMEPIRYNQWTATKYVHRLYEILETGNDEQLRRATRTVERDIRRIAAWARDYNPRGQPMRGRTVRDAEAAAHAYAVLDLMGDPRWAKEIVRQGGRVARRTMEEVGIQQVMHAPVQKLLHSVTMAAVEADGSFISAESNCLEGSDMVTREKPVMEALYTNFGLMAGERSYGGWISPSMERRNRWTSEQTKKWLEVVRYILKAWMESDWEWDPGFIRHIAWTLEMMAPHDKNTELVREYASTIEGTISWACSVQGKDKEQLTQSMQRKARLLGEGMAKPAVLAIRQAARIEDELGGEHHWYTKHSVWMSVAEAHMLCLHRDTALGTAGEALRRAVTNELWEQTKGYLAGWAPGHAKVVNMMVQMKHGSHPLRKYKNKATNRADALLRLTRRAVSLRLAKLYRDSEAMAALMLSEHVTLEGKALLIHRREVRAGEGYTIDRISLTERTGTTAEAA